MDERKRAVLRAIVDDYIRTAEPVGSRTVARKYGLGVSPATIRNEMADLEDMGYLEQPHTSAGRVPSDKGYRYYVDTLVAGEEADAVDAEAVRSVLAVKAQRIEAVIRQATHLLAETTDFLALASQPAGAAEHLAALQVIPLRGSEAVIVLVSDDGRVRTKVVAFRHAPSAADLERIGRAFSERLRGAPLAEVGQAVLRAIAAELGQLREVVAEVRTLLGEREDAGERVVVDGATNLLKQPEFREVKKAKAVLGALERQRLVEDMLGLQGLALPGIEVAIGREMAVSEMAECALVTAVYAAPGGVLGRIGVLGPRRMDYGRVIGLVDAVARAVTDTLDAGGREGKDGPGGAGGHGRIPVGSRVRPRPAPPD